MGNQNLLTFIIIVGLAVVIGAISFALYKILNPKLKDNKPTEDEIVAEELNRVLQPIDDDETAKKVNEYKDNVDD